MAAHNLNYTHPIVVEIFHWISGNFNVVVLDEKSLGSTLWTPSLTAPNVSAIHPTDGETLH